MARKKNKVRILENILVEDYAAEGRSLARIDGKVVFIERTVPGDIVDVCLTKSKKDWGEGFPVKFHEYSSRRVQPFCIHFGDCGGCQWQMVPYEEQLRFKQQQVIDALQRIAKVELPEIKTIMRAARDRFFRNKLEFTFGNKKYVSDSSFKQIKQEAQAASGDTVPVRVNLPDANAAGFHARGLFDKVVDIKECWLQSKPSNEVREAVRAFADQQGYTYYDPRNHVGFLRNLQLRVCESGEVMVNLIVGEKDQEKIDALMDHLEKNISGVSTWLYTVNTKWNDSLFDLQPITWSGKGFAIEHLYTGNGDEHYQFKIGPISFFQTNTKQAEKLYQVTRDYSELTGKEIVYDLYCGTGSIGIFVSGQAKKIIGVELIAAAIEDAKENAALNNIDKTIFFAGDVVDICNAEFFEKHGRPDVIITDPPRAGMHEKLVKKILDIGAPTLVYVSCNPSTQARDLRLLDEKYRVTAVQPVDMFPHTHHIETVVQLKLKNE